MAVSYDARDELHGRFGEVVPDDLIESLADELSSECPEWAAQLDLSKDDILELYYAVPASDYFDEYNTAMKRNRALLDIEVPASVTTTLYGMVFVNLITIMETYLSDTFIGLVPHSEELMRKFVATTPEFKDRKVLLADVYNSLDEIPRMANKYLSSVVWHRLAVVTNMYRDTLDVSFPEGLRDIFRAIEVRHALVHRNGKIDGTSVEITKERVQELAVEIDRFINSIAKQIKLLYNEDLPL